MFYDWKDFNQVTVRLQVHGRAVSVFQGKFYFNVTRANRCHTFDTLTRQVAYIDYPPVTKKQSHFAYFDDAARQMYVVKKVKANQYLIFLYQPGDGSLTLQGESEVEPQGFTGGKMHIMKRLKLPGEKPFFGHYLRPLTPEPVTDERPRMILKTVEIKQ
ncbi:MAG: hypothetical protein MUC97_12600 [Bernardetiaceae bacterium]|nr:hypothetical protein [Bernardetiaceae bacterium]